ncbi:MAG: HIT domain-containing protein [Lentisphaeria bacterium]|nr:HIT domain-containing protein [Lentisphaeria bacterium]
MEFDNHCVFCKIIAGEIPAAKIYEDDKVLSFLDIAPFNFGHALVIPKTHCHGISDLPDDYRDAIFAAAAKIAPAIMRATGALGFNLLMNNGQVAGQEVPHAHLHIIPRFVDDKVLLGASQKQYQGSELAEMQAKIQEKIAARNA